MKVEVAKRRWWRWCRVMLVAIVVLNLNYVALTVFHPAQKAAAATLTWDGGGTDGTCGGSAGDGNKMSCALNWSGDTLPTSTDAISFSGTSTKNAVADTAFTSTIIAYASASPYTGTITLQRSLTMTGSFVHSGGTFNAGANNMSVGTGFTIGGGTAFTAPSTTLTVGGTIGISGGTFNANNGTVKITGSNSAFIDCNSSVNFNLVQFELTGSGSRTIRGLNTACTIPLGNNPTVNSGGTSTHIVLTGFTGGSAILSGSGTLTYDGTIENVTNSALSGFSAVDGDDFINTSTSISLSAISQFTLSNNLTITAGTVTAPSGTLSVGNVFTNNGTFTANSGTVVATASSPVTYVGTFTGSSALHNFTVSGAGSVTLPASATTTLTGGLTSTSSGGVVQSGGTVELRGSSSATFGPTSGTSTWTLNNLTFSNSSGSARTITTGTGGSGTVTIGGILIVGASGDTAATNLSMGNIGWVLSGTSGTPFRPLASPAASISSGTSTVTFSGNNTSGNTTVPTVSYYDLVISNASETYDLGGVTSAHNLTLANGTLDATTNNYILTVSGNFAKQSGTFTPRAGTVYLNGTSQQVSGSSSFYNLAKSTAAADSLTFAAGSTQTVTGALTLSGAASNRLSLRSSAAGSSWFINPSGSRSVQYLDVMDSTNTNLSAIDARDAGNIDSGNNGGWIFGTAITSASTTTAAATSGAAATPSATQASAETEALTSESSVTTTAAATTKPITVPQFQVRVVNNKNQPLEGAEVYLAGVNARAKTNKQGYATFRNIPAGTYLATATYKGKKASQKLTVAMGQVNAITITVPGADSSVRMYWWGLLFLLPFILFFILFKRRHDGKDDNTPNHSA
ncbi:MAG TPA: carboxypeptidase regulatory-like domain-containing protein [Nevskiaceae bacterium]|nr:carboxypeptidase regulatory-like domain-containing protein [Nevskiaceae bacterium]